MGRKRKKRRKGRRKREGEKKERRKRKKRREGRRGGWGRKTLRSKAKLKHGRAWQNMEPQLLVVTALSAPSQVSVTSISFCHKKIRALKLQGTLR